MSEAEQEEVMVVFPMRCDSLVCATTGVKDDRDDQKRVSLFHYDFISSRLYHHCIILVSFMKHIVKEIVRRTCT